MQTRPDPSALLDAIARFLEREVKPVTSGALGFRVLIAANLASMVAAELRFEDAAASTEIERLRALLPDVDAGDTSSGQGRRAALDTLNRALSARLRERRFQGEDLVRVTEHITQTLRGELLTASPRFDTSLDIGDDA